MIASLLLSSMLWAGPNSSLALEQVYAAGVERYDAQDWDGAIGEWQKLQSFRVVTAAVEFNLGNAFFKKRDYGRAVLHWERSLRIDPADPDTRANLALVRDLLIDEVPAETAASAVLLERAGRVLDRERASFLAVTCWLLFGISAAVAILRFGTIRRIGAAIAMLAFGLAAVTAPVAWVQVRSHRDRNRLVILAPAIEVRSGPGEQYLTVFTVHEGLVVRGRESVAGWERVRLPGDTEGWVPSAALERI